MVFNSSSVTLASQREGILGQSSSQPASLSLLALNLSRRLTSGTSSKNGWQISFLSHNGICLCCRFVME